MLAVRRVTQVATRRYGSMASRPVMGGGGDDHGHEHPLWERIPFKKGPTAVMVWGSLIGGTSIILWACSFQNKKHGFTK